MKFLIATLLAFASFTASAADNYLIVTLGCYHYEYSREVNHRLNDINPGLGIHHMFNDTYGVAGGAYENSYKAVTGYAVGTVKLFQVHDVRVEFAGGALYGYRKDEMTVQFHGVSPMAGAIITYKYFQIIAAPVIVAAQLQIPL